MLRTAKWLMHRVDISVRRRMSSISPPSLVQLSSLPSNSVPEGVTGHIVSPKHAKIDLINKIITNKKSRDKKGLIFIEGKRIVLDSLSHYSSAGKIESDKVDSIFISTALGRDIPDILDQIYETMGFRSSSSNSNSNSNKKSNSYGNEKRVISSPRPPIYLVDKEIFSRYASDTNATQGVAAVVHRPFFDSSLKDFIVSRGTRAGASTSSSSGPVFILLLDGVSDPGNMGTLVRSAAALGADAVALLRGCCDPWAAKAARASMGSALRIPVYSDISVDNLHEVLQLAGSKGSNISTTPLLESSPALESLHPFVLLLADGSHPSAVDYDKISWSSLFPPPPSGIPSKGGVVFLVLGSEATGVSDDIVRLANIVNSNSNSDSSSCNRGIFVRIPMSRGTESLNVAVAGSILMSRLCRLNVN